MKGTGDISNRQIMVFAGLISLAIIGGYFPDPSEDPVDFWCSLVLVVVLASALLYLAWCLNRCQDIEDTFERNRCRANCIGLVMTLQLVITLIVFLICRLLL
jgi:hypothetical protein